jgi:GNAT superfamily N-acetyltransferase
MLTTDRNRIEYGDFVLSVLDDPRDFECCAEFNCGDGDLSDFFQHDALPHKQELLAATYCLRLKIGAEAAPLPIAFITYSNDTVKTSKNDKNLRAFVGYLSENIPVEKHYPFLPAVKIGRLAVQKNLQKFGIGTYLVNLTKILFTTRNRTGCRFITVDAYNQENVIRFYRKNDFQFLHDNDSKRPTRIMFFDLKRFKPDPEITLNR